MRKPNPVAIASAVAAAALSLAAFAPLAAAQTGPALLLKPLLSEDETWESGGAATVVRDAHAQGSDADFNMSVYEYAGRFREQREKLIPRIGWDIAYYDFSSDIPILDQPLTDVSVAAGLELGKYYDWTAGLTAGIGYAGNSPFGEGDAWYAKATLVVGRKLDKKTDLAFVVDYDGNRTIFPDIPLPGIAYRHEFDPTLSYTIGIPLTSITWKPDDKISFDLTWTIVDRFDARLEYKLSPAWSVIGLLEQRQEGFAVDGIDDHDRLLFQQRRAEAGVRWKPWEHSSLLLAGGYAFGTEFSVGYDQGDSTEVADISDEPYVRLSFERRF